MGSSPSDCNASRDSPFPSPLSYFVELFCNKTLADGDRAGAREKERGWVGGKHKVSARAGWGGWEQLRFCWGEGFAIAGSSLSALTAAVLTLAVRGGGCNTAAPRFSVALLGAALL